MPKCEPIPSNESPVLPQVVVSVSNLEKRFGDFIALDGLSFDVHRGEIFGFLGPNGAGKTTCINIICGLSEPTGGEVVILGHRGDAKQEAKTHIGICPQENIYWSRLTCLEQLTFVGEMYGMSTAAARTRSIDLLAWLSLDEKSDTLADKLSGGMKRRLNICLALIHDPEILILDEPEVGLDPQSRVQVRNRIKTLARDKTIILTTHNMDEADRLADRVAIIDHGKLLLLDTPERLKKTVGEGDIVEIELAMDGAKRLDDLLNSLKVICDQVVASGGTLIMKSKNLIELLPDITARIKGLGFEIKGITLRENTLEDVFIHLTGKRLRQ